MARVPRPIPIGLAKKAARRFWSRVQRGGPDECWPTNWPPNDRGYGVFGLRARQNVYAHRFAWVLLRGPIPRGLCVLHKCDNPPCANPAHLFLGTKTTNAADREAKGRTPQGERSHNAKISNEDARTIRELASLSIRYGEIALRFGMSRGQVSRIVTGKQWKKIS